MKQSLQNIISTSCNWVFPRRCPICGQDERLSNFICQNCRQRFYKPKRTIFSSLPRCYIFSACPYEAEFKRIVIQAKFKHDLESTQILIEFLHQMFLRIPIRFDCITCVPGDYWRNFWRGVDLPATLAKELGKKTNIPYMPALLKRTRYANRQTKRDQDKRQANVRGLFKADQKTNGKSILVIDDIVTTGSTILSVYKSLAKQHPTQIVFLTAGKTP